MKVKATISNTEGTPVLEIETVERTTENTNINSSMGMMTPTTRDMKITILVGSTVQLTSAQVDELKRFLNSN